MKQLLHHLYVLSLPEGVRAYLIQEGGRGLLIGCGPNTDENEAAVLDNLASVGLSPETTDLFLPHGGAEVAGLCGRFQRPGNRTYVRDCEGAWLGCARTAAFWEDQTAVCAAWGVPARKVPDYRAFPAWRQRLADPVDVTGVRDGWRIQVGGYRLEAVDLAGCAPGQLGLWDFERGLLFGGDLLWAAGVPAVPAWDNDSDALGVCLRNLRKVRAMQLTAVYPAHGAPVQDVSARVEETAALYGMQGDAVCDMLCDGKAHTVWDLTPNAAKLDDWARWQALRATAAQTEYLRRCEKISCDPQPDGWKFTLNR